MLEGIFNFTKGDCENEWRSKNNNNSL
jgi:hypothetical protein